MRRTFHRSSQIAFATLCNLGINKWVRLVHTRRRPIRTKSDLRHPSRRCHLEALERRSLLSGVTWYVQNNALAGGNGSTTSPFQSIQAAINAASPGDTVNVGTGTYIEQITDTKSLQIVGAGASSTTIQSPSSPLQHDSSGALSIVTISGSSTNTEFTGFTVTGPGPGGPDSIDFGIFVRDGATANIHDDVIANIADNPIAGTITGVSIGVGNQGRFATTGSATISHNEIYGYQWSGIVVDNAGSSATISNNVVTGNGLNPCCAEAGIQITNGADGTVVGNTISGNEVTNPNGGPVYGTTQQSIAIYVAQSGMPVEISGNTIDANDVGIWSQCSETMIDGNSLGTASPNRYEGMILSQGDASLTNNTILGGNIGLLAIEAFGTAPANALVVLGAGNLIAGASLEGIQLRLPFASSYVPNLLVSGDNTLETNAIGMDIQAGSVTIAPGATLTMSSFPAGGGSTGSNGSVGAGNVTIDGTLSGSGTINASVTNAGQVIPGGTGAAGILTFNGNYTQTTTGSLNLELGGTTPGTQYDQLNINGPADLGGTLNLSVLPNLGDVCGDTFATVNAGPLTGTFSTVNGLSQPGGLILIPAYGAGSLTVTAKLTPTMTITASADPSLLNQPVTFTATVALPAGATDSPTGTVQFQIDHVNFGAPVSLTAGQASLSTSPLAAGSHTITALYSGDDCFSAGSGGLTQSVQYKFSGFLAPLSTSLSYGLGRTIPIKFQLTDSNGAFITSPEF
jgi:hypothetical protein